MDGEEKLPSIDEILAAMDAHAARNLELAKATLEAAAAQAAILEEQKKQTKLIESKEALERGQFLKISEIELLIATQQELLKNINIRLKILEDTQNLSLHFIKAVLESQAQLSPKSRKRLSLKVAQRSAESIKTELRVHYRSLDTAREKAARFGMNVPLELVNEISYLDEEIERLEQELESTRENDDTSADTG